MIDKKQVEYKKLISLKILQKADKYMAERIIDLIEDYHRICHIFIQDIYPVFYLHDFYSKRILG